MSQDHKLSEMKNMGSDVQAKLAEMGISSIEQLLAKATERAERAALAKQIAIEPSQLTEWINRADLMRLKGVGYEMANLLEECGVDSCKELQHRVPANLQAKLKTTNDERKITHHAPTVDQVTAWVAEAKEIAAS